MMAIAYSTIINSLKTTDVLNAEGVTLQKAIVNVEWTKTATEGSVSVSISGSLSLDPRGTSSNNFISFSSVTEDQVKSWINSKYPDVENLHKKMLIALIDEQSMSSAALPWG